MSNLWQDVRYGARSLRKQPGFAAVAVLVLALGIGANAAVFTLVNVVLLRPVVGATAGGELVGLFCKDKTRPDRYRPFSYPNYVDLRDASKSFSNVAAYTLALVGLTEGDTTKRSFSFLVSSNYFAALGVEITRGRGFTADEEDPLRASPVAVVSDAYWKRMGADPHLIGKPIRVSSQPYTVVGIAPEGFSGVTPVITPDIWLPLGMYGSTAPPLVRASPTAQLVDRRNHSLLVVGRIRPGITQEAARREAVLVADRLEREYPAENRDYTVSLHALTRMSISDSPQDEGDLTTAGLLLVAMSSIVLVIACLNLANLLLARGSARRKEIAIRLAIGGGRWRIVRQLLTEGLLLSLLGGAAGLVLAVWAAHLLMSSLAPLMPMAMTLDVRPDARVFAATLGFSVLSTLIFGLGPAWKLSRPGVAGDLREQTGTDRSRRGRRFGGRQVLVAAQLALSLSLLVAGGLFVRGAVRATSTDPGFRLERGLVIEVDPSLAGYDETRSRQAHLGLLDRLRRVPGVEVVSFSSIVPFGMVTEQRRIERADAPATGETAGDQSSRESVSANSYTVGSDYMRSLGLPLLRGRDFTTSEAEAGTTRPIAIIDEPLARRLWPQPGDNPIGQYVRLVRDSSASTPEEPMEVVGIVPGLRHSLLDRTPAPHIYLPFSRGNRSWMFYHVRLASGGPDAEAAMLRTIRQEIRAYDERLPVVSMRTLRGHHEAGIVLWTVRAGARLFTVLGVIALLLAVVGIYGVHAFMVARRTREIGIRMALGASRRNVIALVLGDGALVAAAGAVVGLLLAAGVGQLLASMLYEVSALDPLAFIAAPVLLVLAAIAACYVPARRAARVEPTRALRYE